MKLIVLLVIGVILFFIARNYKTERFKNINLKVKEKFDGDLMNHEAGLLVALMAKVAKADGQVCELEAELLKHTFNDISSHFENSEEIRDRLKELYINEKKSFDNTIDVCNKLHSLTKFDYAKRVKILEYLLNLAFIDKEFSDAEKMICEDISNALKIKQTDFDNIVNNFIAFYAQQASNKALNLEKAYEVLEASPNDDAATLKKKYRSLVKKHHPDIISGQGASQSIIDEATKKLQEINEAYELIKKEKGL
ncbi:molecular chaperone DjlA [Malaciobacter pacificus]|jgi:DnaJ like chaperone protein|uniref:DnaJ-like membrane chaperone protein n=1 Tax=Malaciobacter pacificus TaxID=1080223 RepID=A0A5C2H8T3_9BACT|nr:TerB family tellurite resistance protein [Malaciobacter pacificus]QEP34628.1 DnaJ-like membrane chaperone protein [Malaciobacter pacificus]GGD37261.1 molecular chaperone DjlA [Malaciobacter pacificus]